MATVALVGLAALTSSRSSETTHRRSTLTRPRRLLRGPSLLVLSLFKWCFMGLVRLVVVELGDKLPAPHLVAGGVLVVVPEILTSCLLPILGLP